MNSISKNINARNKLNNSLDKESSEVTSTSRHISISGWFFLGISTLATFIAFMTLDPKPSLLLSFCTSINVAIFIGSIYRLYQLDLLLSPMMVAFVGPTMIMYYSWGNLGARIAGEGRFAANFGTLNYYPLASLLSTIGLLLYCLVVFFVFKKSFRNSPIKYQDLYWKPKQVLFSILFGIAVLVYLSVKYDFIGGYFSNAEGQFDRSLIVIVRSLVFLMIVISVSVMVKSNKKFDSILGILGIVISIILTIGLRSRTFMIMALLLIIFCWITINPKIVRLSFFLIIAFLCIAIFSFGSMVKSLQGNNESIIDNIKAITNFNSLQIVSITSQMVEVDQQYRTGGFEYPAALLRCFDIGVQPAYGEGFIGAALQGLPGFLRPIGTYEERGFITVHYLNYCPFRDDAMAIPLVSGLGDWGYIGIFIYLIMGVFSLLLWRIAQKSPRLFLSYLLVPYFPDNLFWTGVFTYAKTIAFLWLLLWVFRSLFMPKWIPSTKNH